eukprot:162132-Amphidinium_carterae.1
MRSAVLRLRRKVLLAGPSKGRGKPSHQQIYWKQGDAVVATDVAVTAAIERDVTWLYRCLLRLVGCRLVNFHQWLCWAHQIRRRRRW